MISIQPRSVQGRGEQEQTHQQAMYASSSLSPTLLTSRPESVSLFLFFSAGERSILGNRSIPLKDGIVQLFSIPFATNDPCLHGCNGASTMGQHQVKPNRSNEKKENTEQEHAILQDHSHSPICLLDEYTAEPLPIYAKSRTQEGIPEKLTFPFKMTG